MVNSGSSMLISRLLNSGSSGNSNRLVRSGSSGNSNRLVRCGSSGNSNRLVRCVVAVLIVVVWSVVGRGQGPVPNKPTVSVDVKQHSTN